jgi:aminoglycoside 3-N-acetyltransferase
MSKITFHNIRKTLGDVGVQSGDTILVHSFLGSFGQFEHNLETVVAGLRAAVGVDGTIVIPTYTIHFLSGQPYNQEESASETGILSEYFRTYPDVRRTHCPVYSHAVWGAKRDEYVAVQSVETLGPESLFAQLHADNALQVHFGTSMDRGTTFLHYFERVVLAPYRYSKIFKGKVTRDGVTRTEQVVHYARFLSKPAAINFNPFGEELIEAGLMKEEYINRGRVTAIRLPTLFVEAYKRYEQDKMFLVKEDLDDEA